MTTPPPRNRWRHPLFALVLPALLLALGTWQLTRGWGAADGYDARTAGLEASSARLRALAARNPRATIRFDGSPIDFTVTDALHRIDQAHADSHTDALVQRARDVAAYTTATGGTIALLAAIAGLVATAIGARRGMRTRTDLVGSFRVVVRLLPPLLGCVAVGTAFAAVGAVLYEIGGAWFEDRIQTGEVKLILVGLGLAFGALVFAVSSVRQLRRALQAFTPTPLDILGRAVDPMAAPGLWTFIRDIATRQGATPPDNVVLGLIDGFFVTSSKILLAPEERLLAGRSLYLPAPFLPMLSQTETAAIIAHELAHFTGEDTQYSQHFLPLYASMGRSMAAVTSSRRAQTALEAAFQPAAVIARHVLDTFEIVVNHWNRQREFGADHESLRVAPGRPAATALIRTGMAAQLVGTTLDEVYERPARAAPDVIGAIMARAGAVGFLEPGRHLEDRQPHPTDSHPPTRQRIEALGVPIDDTLLAEASRPMQPADETFAASLFTDWPGLRQTLGADLLVIAHERDKTFQATLERAAAAITADIPVHERALRATIGLGISGAVLVGVALFVTWLALASHWIVPRDISVLWGTAALLGSMGLLFSGLAYSRHRRGRAGPYLVVGPTGFRCIGIPEPVPWSTVDWVQVTSGQAFVTTFHFAPGAPLPTPTTYRWSVKVSPRKRLLQLKGFIPRGMKPQAYLDLLTSALRAHQAQLIIRAREAEAANAA